MSAHPETAPARGSPRRTGVRSRRVVSQARLYTRHVYLHKTGGEVCGREHETTRTLGTPAACSSVFRALPASRLPGSEPHTFRLERRHVQYLTLFPHVPQDRRQNARAHNHLSATVGREPPSRLPAQEPVGVPASFSRMRGPQPASNAVPTRGPHHGVRKVDRVTRTRRRTGWRSSRGWPRPRPAPPTAPAAAARGAGGGGGGGVAATAGAAATPKETRRNNVSDEAALSGAAFFVPEGGMVRAGYSHDGAFTSPPHEFDFALRQVCRGSIHHVRQEAPRG